MTTTVELETAKDQLISLLSDTDTIYTVLRSVSKSGLSRVISFYIIDNKEIVNINYYIKTLLGYKFNKTRDGLIIKGGGMDMGFHVIHTLKHKLGISEKISHRWI